MHTMLQQIVISRPLQLHRAETLINDLYQNKEFGLKSVVGPSLGLLDETYALDLEGCILGYVAKSVPHSGSNDALVQVDEECELPLRYCLADSSGYIFPGSLADQSLDGTNCFEPTLKQSSSRNSTVLGKLAWNPCNHKSRVLVMGGNQISRDNFLRWYADVELFEYEEICSNVTNIKDACRNDEGSVNMATESVAIRSSLPYSFKIIASFDDSQRERQYSDLMKKQQEMRRSHAHIDPDSRRALDDEVKRFRHRGGESTQASSVINEKARLTWPLLTDHAALHLLYLGGAAACSPLGQFGRVSEFISTYTSRVRTLTDKDDASKYFCAEVLLSQGDRLSKEILRPPDSLLFINAPDILSPNLGLKGCGSDVWERIGHLVPELLATCRLADTNHVKSLSLSKFIELLKDLRPGGFQVSEADARKLSDLLVIDGTGRVEYEGLTKLIASKSCPYDQEAAFGIIAEVCDVIVVLLDGKLSRFNDVETSILKGLSEHHKHKMYFGCIDNHSCRSELGAHLAEVLADPGLCKIANVGHGMSDTNGFINAVVNAEQIRLNVLLHALRYNMESLLLRLEHLYARSGTICGDSALSLCESIIDGHAVAAANATLIRACKVIKSLVGPSQGMSLLEQVRSALRVAKQAAQNVMSRVGFVPLSYAQRCDLWEAQAKRGKAIRDAVLGLHVSQWITDSHIDFWLESVGVTSSSKAVFQAEGICNVHALLSVDSARMVQWGLPLWDRLRIQRGLLAVKRAFEQRRSEYVHEGLWRLVDQEASGCSKVSVRIDPSLLFDQGPETAPKLGGWRDGDKVMLEAPGHGRVEITVPCRVDLERASFKVEMEMHNGYISPQDLSLMYAVLTEELECGANSRRMLEDGLHLMLIGELPPLLLAEVVGEIRAEARAVPDHVVKQAVPEQKITRMYSKRWAHDAAIVAEQVPDSDSEDEWAGDELDLMTREDARRCAEEGLHRIFDAVANGRVTADGSKLQTELYRDRRVLCMLRRLDIRFLPGRVAVLDESDVLQREFVEGILSLD